MDPTATHPRTHSITRPIGAAVAELNLGLSELAKLAAWMTAYVAGVVSSFFETRPAVACPGLRRSVPPRISHRPIKPPPPEALPLLTEAIVGSSKFTIASVLGAPRSAVSDGLAAVEANAKYAFYQTDTWYYPLPRHGQVAMAVMFADNIARRVEFFHAPGVDRLGRSSR